MLFRSETGITYHALLSWDGDRPAVQGAMLPEPHSDLISRLGGQVCQRAEEDGLLTRLLLPFGEVPT